MKFPDAPRRRAPSVARALEVQQLFFGSVVSCEIYRLVDPDRPFFPPRAQIPIGSTFPLAISLSRAWALRVPSPILRSCACVASGGCLPGVWLRHRSWAFVVSLRGCWCLAFAGGGVAVVHAPLAHLAALQRCSGRAAALFFLRRRLRRLGGSCFWKSNSQECSKERAPPHQKRAGNTKIARGGRQSAVHARRC